MFRSISDLVTINNFSNGECSSRFFLRNDASEKKNYIVMAQNVIPHLHGGLYKRGGLVNIHDELCFNEYIRLFFYDDNTLIILSLSGIYVYYLKEKKKYKLAEQILASLEQLKELHITSCGDFLLITHKSLKPKVIKKNRFSEWTIADFYISANAFVDIDIYFRESTVVIKDSSLNNSSIVFSFINHELAKSYYNDILYLLSSGGGAQLCEKIGAGVFFISAISDISILEKNVTLTAKKISPMSFVQDEYASTVFQWKRMMFLSGYPSYSLFHEGRLIFSSYENNENILYFSKVNNYSSFDSLEGEAASAFYKKLTSSPGEIITGLISGLSLQIFTNKKIYVMQNSGYIPLEVATFGLNKVAYVGSLNLFSNNINNETLYIGTDSHLYCLQKKGAVNFEPLNLSLLCNKKDIVNLSSGSYYYSAATKNDNESSNKIEYIFVVYSDGTCGVVQYRNDIGKLCWSSFKTKIGSIKQVLYVNNEFYFVINNINGEYLIYKFDINSTTDDGFSIDVEIESLPILPFYYMPTGEVAKMQGLPCIYTLFECDDGFLINNISTDAAQTNNIYNDIKIVKVDINIGWEQIINLNIKYSGDKDFKLYGLIMPIVRT